MPDAEPLKLAMLAEVVPELWAKLIFAPHPTAIRLTFTTRRYLVRLARGDRSAAVGPVARTTNDPRLAARRDGTLPPAWRGGSDDVGRGDRRHALPACCARWLRPMAAKREPTSAPRPISRIGSTWGAWLTAALRRSKVAAKIRHPRRGKQRGAPPGEPIGEEPDPFPRGNVHPP